MCNNPKEVGMFKREYAVLVVFVIVIILALPFTAFSVEKADRDALLQEMGGFIDNNPDILKKAIFSMGDYYVSKNYTAEAIALYEKAAKILPPSEDLFSTMASLYNKKQDYAKAAEIYKKMTELKPDNLTNFQMLANAYKNAGQKDKVVSVWENLMKNSNNPEVFMQAASFYFGENDLEKAIATIKKAIEIMPSNIAYQQTLEGYYFKAGKFADAELVCNKASSSAKDAWFREWADMELINIYQKQNKLPELAARFEKELSQSTKDISKYKRLSELYQKNKEQDKATATYEKAIAQGLDDKDTNIKLLDLYERTNKLDKAELQLRKVISMSPDDNYLYQRLANLLNNAGKKEDAKKAWEQLLAKTPNDAGAFSRYGERLNAWGDFDAAITQYRKAQSLDPANLWYTVLTSNALAAKGDVDGAKKELNDVIAKTKDTWMKQTAESKIKDLETKLKGPAVVPQPVSSTPAVTPAKAATPAVTSVKPETKPK